jgi:hypothetical protein
MEWSCFFTFFFLAYEQSTEMGEVAPKEEVALTPPSGGIKER